MRSRTIFVVFGETGEYSDHTEWMVAAYTMKKEAKKHVTLCEQWDIANNKAERRYDRSYPKNPYDKDAETYMHDVKWVVREVMLRGRTPKVQVQV